MDDPDPAPRTRRRTARAPISCAFAVIAALTGCGGNTSAGDPAGDGAATGTLTVFAAASLTEAFTDVEGAIEAAHPGLDLRYSFAGSGSLVAQIVQGAPADVVATADTVAMQALVDAGLVDAPVTFARNRLEILVAPGNPLGVTGLADLDARTIRVVLPDDNVPAGRYAEQALAAAGVDVRPVSKEVNVKAAVAKVVSGEVDAAIVYATDVDAVGSRGHGVTIPDGQNVVATYPVAVLRRTRHRAAAAAFVTAVVSGVGAQRLRAAGFLAGVDP